MRSRVEPCWRGSCLIQSRSASPRCPFVRTMESKHALNCTTNTMWTFLLHMVQRFELWVGTFFVTPKLALLLAWCPPSFLWVTHRGILRSMFLCSCGNITYHNYWDNNVLFMYLFLNFIYRIVANPQTNPMISLTFTINKVNTLNLLPWNLMTRTNRIKLSGINFTRQ